MDRPAAEWSTPGGETSPSTVVAGVSQPIKALHFHLPALERFKSPGRASGQSLFGTEERFGFFPPAFEERRTDDAHAQQPPEKRRHSGPFRDRAGRTGGGRRSATNRKSTCFLNVSTRKTWTVTAPPSWIMRRLRRPTSWLRAASNT